MNVSGLRYAKTKLNAAVSSMAVGAESLGERLAAAWCSYLMLVRPEDLPEAARWPFRKLYEIVSAGIDGGRSRLSDAETEVAVRRLVQVTDEVAAAYGECLYRETLAQGAREAERRAAAPRIFDWPIREGMRAVEVAVAACAQLANEAEAEEVREALWRRFPLNLSDEQLDAMARARLEQSARRKKAQKPDAEPPSGDRGPAA